MKKLLIANIISDFSFDIFINIREETHIMNFGVDTESDFIPIIAESNEEDTAKSKVPDQLPILALRNTVLFPGVVIPIAVGRDKSLQLIREAYKKDKLIGTVSQKESSIEDPAFNDLNLIGTLGQIIKILEMPDNSTTIIIQGKKRIRIIESITEDPYLIAKAKGIHEVEPEIDSEFEAIIASLKDLAIKIIQLSPQVPPEAAFAIKNIEKTSFLINYICSNTEIDIKEKQLLLEKDDLKQRANILLEFLSREVQKLQLRNDIQTKVKSELDKQQREYLLNQQMKTIQNELGKNPVDHEIEELKVRAKKKKWNKQVEKTFNTEIEKLARINPASPDYSNQLNYLELLIELPWNEYTKDSFDLKRAKKILEEDHYGLDEVKERILEHLAVLKLKGDLKSPIICLHGPPGVGKTSLGKSIARALKRKYARMSLGGLHDEAEIRGHRKTYIGALPGRIIQNIKKANSSNPVFVLDEIDKVGNDFRGDPSFALLEVLDPEQNNAFYDNYLEMEYDLSHVMFIATANSLSTIKPALLDRMELINVSGYSVEEKIEIAKRHLIPKQLKLHGVKKDQLTFHKKVLEEIIVNYTRESGVRELEKRLAKIIRHIAKKIGFGEEYDIALSLEELYKILGPQKYFKDKYQGNEFAGVVTGLAWTAVGGDILFIETSLSKGKGDKLTLTGNLGNVMKESAVLALEYLKSHAKDLMVKEDAFDSWNVHLHIPEGAIPKDGPSAGITMVTALASAFTQRKVRKSIAMTGEITLRGKVLPVGGIKEKILAAKRGNIREIILPKDNINDVIKINENFLKGLNFHYIDTIMDCLEIALTKQKVKDPLKVA
jgi:ATP-dependent Lon protease